MQLNNTVEMTNREMIGILNSLEAMAVREKKAIEANPGYKRMNIKVVHKIFSNKRMLHDKLVPYEDSLKELTKQYNVKMEITGLNTENLEKDKREEFLKELNELLDIDTEVNVARVNIEQFGDYDISQEDMAALEFMIV